MIQESFFWIYSQRRQHQRHEEMYVLLCSLQHGQDGKTICAHRWINR